MDAKIKNIWIQNYANQSAVNISIIQQNELIANDARK
jgi:hypothetical protein